MGYFRKKSVSQIIQESNSEGHQLHKTLGLWSLIAIGIGCIIGTGIFVLTGKVAIENAGPGIMISFMICGFACILAALCYAEFASFIPISGSAYTYSYASMGELVAWVIGWDLILEYGLSTAAVASGWSSHFVNFLDLISSHSIKFPEAWALTPFESIYQRDAANNIMKDASGASIILSKGIMNLPAMFISAVITLLLIVGIRESAKFNNLIVIIKTSVAVFFIGVGLFFIDMANWAPIIPEFVPSSDVIDQTIDANKTPLYQWLMNKMGMAVATGFGGWTGIFTGAAVIFFAYIGFDAVSTTSEEAINPKRDVPRAIIWSLLICTALYILMSMVFTGIVKCDGTLKFDELGTFKGAPLAYAFSKVQVNWVNGIALFLIELGGLCGITSVLLVTLLGQSRVFFSMSRDRLLPHWIGAEIHPKFKTPWKGTMITGLVVILVTGFVPLDTIAEMANIGTLFAFVLVSAGIIYLRKYQPEHIATFRTPLVPFIPILAIIFCVALMFSLPAMTWVRFILWMVLGMVIYFTYSYKNSKMNKK